MEHVELVKSVLASTVFYEEYVNLVIPLQSSESKDACLRININMNTQQITVDACPDGHLVYSGVFASDMSKPMCPMFKH